MTKSFLAGLLLASSTAWGVSFDAQVIYGNDDRKDLNEVSDAMVREVAGSTAAMIAVSDLRGKSEGGADLVSRTLGQKATLCREERFFDQPASANCSAFLVGPDLMATAGHCIQESTCGRYAMVFGFHAQADGTIPSSFGSDDIYRCKKVVGREFFRAQDWSLVQLDRPVVGRQILKLATQGVQVNDSLTVIGHPSGLPTKVASSARVRSVLPEYFVSNLDTYGGNSGSAVFNADSLEVVGILVRGATDYVWDIDRACRKSNYCDETGCRGEDSTQIKYIVDAIQAHSQSSGRSRK